MNIETALKLRNGDLLYRVDDESGPPRVVEWRIVDCQRYESGGMSGVPKVVCVQRTKMVPDKPIVIDRLSLNDLEKVGATPGDAALLYVQGKIRVEMDLQNMLRSFVEAKDAARAWYSAWHADDRKVW